MRSIAVLLLLATTARADVGIALFGQASRYADQSQSAGGLAFEISLDRDRWQYFTEVGVASLLLGDKEPIRNSDGAMVRGAIGTRYLARRFSIERVVAFELGFEALVGMQDLEWRDRERDVRPEVALGFNWNFELVKWGFASRWSVRAYFAPAPMSSGDLCIGPCMTTSTITSGYMALMGVTW